MIIPIVKDSKCHIQDVVGQLNSNTGNVVFKSELGLTIKDVQQLFGQVSFIVTKNNNFGRITQIKILFWTLK